MMTHADGNVESPCPFVSIYRTNERKLFPRDTGQVGPDLGDRVPEDLFHLVLGPPDHLDSGHSGHLAAHHLGLGRAYGFAQDYNGITPVEPVQVEEWWTGDALTCVGVV